MSVNKSTFPPPPPFYQLYTQPHSGTVGGKEKETHKAEPSRSAFAFDIYTPPPPLRETFIKFGEVQTVRIH
jgi:hypothetical protein